LAGKYAKKSKPVIISRIMRDYIAEGVWLPGDKFSSFEVAKLLGVGRSSVNESIKVLEGKGFLHILPNVGFTVRRLERQDLSAFLDVWYALMQLANDYFLIPEKRSALELLKSNLKLVYATFLINEDTATISGIEEYHFELFSLIDVSYLVKMMKETTDLFYYCMVRMKNKSHELLERLILLEQHYLDALVEGDASRAAAVLKDEKALFRLSVFDGNGEKG
jgi:DNA-binding GntR family transcriptional regulator